MFFTLSLKTYHFTIGFWCYPILLLLLLGCFCVRARNPWLLAFCKNLENLRKCRSPVSVAHFYAPQLKHFMRLSLQAVSEVGVLLQASVDLLNLPPECCLFKYWCSPLCSKTLRLVGYTPLPKHVSNWEFQASSWPGLCDPIWFIFPPTRAACLLVSLMWLPSGKMSLMFWSLRTLMFTSPGVSTGRMSSMQVPTERS